LALNLVITWMGYRHQRMVKASR